MVLFIVNHTTRYISLIVPKSIRSCEAISHPKKERINQVFICILVYLRFECNVLSPIMAGGIVTKQLLAKKTGTGPSQVLIIEEQLVPYLFSILLAM